MAVVLLPILTTPTLCSTVTNTSPHESPPRVLLVEDNPGDSRIALELFAEAGSIARITTATDGLDAIRRLREEPPPDLVLLDLNLPGAGGRDILKFIRSEPRLRLLPVVVMTTSRSEADVTACYGLGANCYIAKPLHLDEFSRVIALIDQFWLNTAVLPPQTVPSG